MDDAALKDELDNDPATLGYAAAGWSASPPSEPQYQAIVDLINEADIASDVNVSGTDLFVAIKPIDFQAVFDTGTAAAQAYMKTIFAIDVVPLSDSGVRTAIQAIFAGKTETLANIAALKTDISRATQIGLGKVSVGDLMRIKGDL